MMNKTILYKFVKEIINELHEFENCEIAIQTIPRDEAVAQFVIRCLANPDCEGSREMLDAIIDHRADRLREE